jgi:hypothetical protein
LVKDAGSRRGKLKAASCRCTETKISSRIQEVKVKSRKRKFEYCP